ncbi:MAG TPA: YihY family inner membrane protein [Zoogloea sp.]|nr:YihY family inner membrane protein [Zoogloea sp.]
MNSALDSGNRLRSSVVALQRLLGAVLRRFRDGRCSQVAASLAFTSLLSLVPFVTLVAVVFSKFPQSQRFRDALQGFLLDNLLPEKAGKVIATYAFQFSQKATNLTIVGGVVLILTAIMLMRTIDQVINQIWRVQAHRPWASRLVAYWAVLSLGPLLLAGGVFAAGAMLSVSLDLMNEPVWLEVAGLRLVSLGVLSGVFATLYFAVPHCSVRLADAGLAGLLAAGAFLVMQRLFGLYLAHFPSYTLVYGAFAVVPIFLLWLYLSWIIILLGAVVAAVLPERSLRRRPLPDFPGRPLYVALLILAELAEAQSLGECRSVVRLADVARVGHDEVREVLALLSSSRIVVRGDSGGWLLVRSAEGVLLSELVALFGLAPLPDIDGRANGPESWVVAPWQHLLAAVQMAADVSLSQLLERGRAAPQRG